MPAPNKNKPNIGTFLGVLGILAGVFVSLFLANIVEMNWINSAVIYCLILAFCIWSFLIHAAPHRSVGYRIFWIIGYTLIIAGLGCYGTLTQYHKEHKPALIQPTPIQDNAMRLITALDSLRSDWITNNLTQNQELEQIRTGEYERWIVRVHEELFTHNRHSSNFDEVALLSGLGTLENTFRVSTNSMTNILSNITEDVKKLLIPPLNE